MLDRPLLGALDESRADPPSPRCFIDDERREPGRRLADVYRLKEMDGHQSDYLTLPILGDEHSSARPGVKLVDSFRDVSGIGGVPQLREKPAERWRIS
jgi:hypothetical protein